MSEPKQQCPQCGERAGVPILYGMATPETFDDPDIAIGGCIVDHDSPNRRCLSCGHAWRATFEPGPPISHEQSVPRSHRRRPLPKSSLRRKKG